MHYMRYCGAMQPQISKNPVKRRIFMQNNQPWSRAGGAAGADVDAKSLMYVI